MQVIKPSFHWIDRAPNGAQMIYNIAIAGRTAYQSERQDREEEFVRNLIKRGHESVLEHEKISIVLTCDRGITHEIVRHRIASYTQESTRYCNYAKGKFGEEIRVIDIREGIKLDPTMKDLSPTTTAIIISEWMDAMFDAQSHYVKMIELGASPQIARGVLPNSLKTEIVISMNLREWRHFFRLRSAPDAHPQMIEICKMILPVFKNNVPVIFDDI